MCYPSGTRTRAPRGLKTEYDWVTHLSNLQIDEGNKNLREWTNGQWVRKSPATEQSAAEEPSSGAGSVTVSFERPGTRVQGLSLANDGTVLQFRVMTDLKKGSTLTIERREWSNERSRWVSVIDRVKVDAKGSTSYSTPIGPWQYVFVKNKSGKTLARIKTES